MEARFSQLTLDVIGKAVFNFDFDALNTKSPVIQVGAACVTWGLPLVHSGVGSHQQGRTEVPARRCLNLNTGAPNTKSAVIQVGVK